MQTPGPTLARRAVLQAGAQHVLAAEDRSRWAQATLEAVGAAWGWDKWRVGYLEKVWRGGWG